MTGRRATAVALAAGALPAAHLAPALAKPLGERALRRRCRRRGALVLSFDDGPGRHLTPRVLDLLAEHGARASFFALGARAEQAPEILDRAVAEGHEVCCHGHGHVDAWRAPPPAAMRDVGRGYDALGRWLALGAAFRPPRGRLSGATWLASRRLDAPLAWWTVDSGDTHATLPSPEEAVAAVVAQGGGVVLLHDFDRDPPEPERDAFVLDVSARLLSAAARQGLTVRRFGELTAA